MNRLYLSRQSLNQLAANANSMLDGLMQFVDRHTKDDPDTGQDYMIVNSKSVLCNNMHYETGSVWYTPNGTATTEGQALYILGLYYAWKGTGKRSYLDRAVRAIDAYLDLFYAGQPTPTTPQIYRANWIINGKRPFQAFGPLDPNNPDSPGGKGIKVQFTNGVGQIPTGDPYNGQLITRLYSVYNGKLSYDSVRSGVNAGGMVYPFASYVTYDGVRHNADQDAIDPNGDTPGTIRLVDTTFTGTALVNYANMTGPTIGRNQPFDVWPIWMALSPDQWGNSIDSEQWFAEACYLMFQETGNPRYFNAFNASIYTINDATDLQADGFYFRQDTKAADPFNVGIAYDWEYLGDAKATLNRDSSGYIHVSKTAESNVNKESTVALEQIAVYTRIDSSKTAMVNTIGINTPKARIEFLTRMKTDLLSDGRQYRYALPSNGSVTPTPMVVPFGQMVTATQSDGQQHAMLDGSSFVPYGNAGYTTTYEGGILGDAGRADWIGTANINDGTSGVVAGFWLATPTTRALTSLTYRVNSGEIWLKVTDALGNKYQRVLPSGGWTTLPLSWSDFTLVPNQAAGTPAAPTPNGAMTQIEFITNNGQGGSISTYCWGEIPQKLVSVNDYSTEWFIHVKCQPAMEMAVGDVYASNPAPLALKYTPGVLPFTTKYSVSRARKDYWRGTPYTGYQYGPMWVLSGKTQYYTNCIAFYYDAQEAYAKKIGVMGPVAPLYVWPRYDQLDQGPIDTFAWGTDKPYPWAGYNARAFFAGCRMWQLLVQQGFPVDTRLITFCERYAKYLADFQDANDNLTPTEFPPDKPAFNDDYDHTGHMTALYMAGAVCMKFAGSKSTYVDRVINGCMAEFTRTQVIEDPTGPYSDMSGAYSSWSHGHYFYGFWAGEIMRALGLLMMWNLRNQQGAGIQIEESNILLENASGHIAAEDGTLIKTETSL